MTITRVEKKARNLRVARVVLGLIVVPPIAPLVMILLGALMSPTRSSSFAFEVFFGGALISYFLVWVTSAVAGPILYALGLLKAGVVSAVAGCVGLLVFAPAIVSDGFGWSVLKSVVLIFLTGAIPGYVLFHVSFRDD